MTRYGQSLADGICDQRCVGSEAVERVRSMLSSEKTLNAAADAFKVLAHNGRLKVLEALDGQELCVCDLSEILGLSMSGTSQQLRELRRLGAIEHRVSGKFVYYRLAERFWLDLAGSVMQRIDSVGESAKEMKRAV